MNIDEKYNRMKEILSKGEITLSEAIEAMRIREEIEPYICPHCYEPLTEEGEEWNGRKWHSNCLKEVRERAREIREGMKKLKKEMEEIRKAHEESRMPKIWFLPRTTVYGLKKDFERFCEDLPEILKKYNLR